MRFHTQTAGVVADRSAAARTTSSGPRSRRWPACSAAPSRCTPTASTRRSRCRPRRRSGSRCARSRSSPMRPGWRTRSIRSAARYFVEALTDRDGGAGLRVLPQDRRARRDGRAVKQGYPQREIADARSSSSGEIDAGRQDRRRRQRVHRGRRRPALRSSGSIPRSSASRSTGSRPRRATATRTRSSAALTDLKAAAAGDGAT